MTERQHDGGTRRRIHVHAAPSRGGNGAEQQPPQAPAPEAATGEPGSAPAEGDELAGLRAALEAARAEADELRSAWQRSAADFQNYRRRSEQEREASLGLASEALIRKLLAVVDDFDRALEAMPADVASSGWVEGVWLVERKLRALLESEGLTPIEAVGRPFDPREHEAVVHQETTDAPDGTVIAELQRGYRLRDRVLRPALVAVANNVGGRETPGGEH